MKDNQNTSSSFIENVIGPDGVKFDVSLSWNSIIYLLIGATAVGIVLILFSRVVK
ncbi:MAG TPA: hypothetical protein PK495_08320 [Bacteroidales bacterium]|nr:hypothetical protein [Bacteroidales bacterium]HQB20563.1 hypothetical protein [Bacteroidales bacterium]